MQTQVYCRELPRTPPGTGSLSSVRSESPLTLSLVLVGLSCPAQPQKSLQQPAASCSPWYWPWDPLTALQTSLRRVCWVPASMPGIEGRHKVSDPE